MSKQLVLTLSDDMYKKLEVLSKQTGTSKLEYIRFLIMKDIEAKDKPNA